MKKYLSTILIAASASTVSVSTSAEPFSVLDDILGEETSAVVADVVDIAKEFKKLRRTLPAPIENLSYYDYASVDDFNIQMYSSTKAGLAKVDVRIVEETGDKPISYSNIPQPMSTWLSKVESSGGDVYVCYRKEEWLTSAFALIRLVLSGAKALFSIYGNYRTFNHAKKYDVVLEVNTTKEEGLSEAGIKRVMFLHKVKGAPLMDKVRSAPVCEASPLKFN